VGLWYIYRFLVWLFGEKLAQAILFILALIGMGFFFVSTWRGGSLSTTITRSTIRREPLPAGTVHETGYLRYGGHLVNEEAAIDGMRYFYEKTGVQPCLWIAERIDGSGNPSWETIDAALERLYQTSFTDQGHLLVLFHEPRPEDYKTAYYVGDAAELILDEEATDILLDYLDKYYYDGDLSEGEYFGAAFTKSADRIMSVSADPKIIRNLMAAAICAMLIFAIVVQARKRRQRPLSPAQAKPERPAAGPKWRGYSLDYIGNTLRKPLALFLIFMVITVILAEELDWFADGTANPVVFLVVPAPLALTALYWGIFLAALKPERNRTKPKSTGPQKPGDGWGVLFFEVFVAPLRNVKRTMIIVLCAVFAFMVILLCYHDNFTKRVGGATGGLPQTSAPLIHDQKWG
jgi:hypothetical protein